MNENFKSLKRIKAKGILKVKGVQENGEPLTTKLARIIETGSGIEKVAETLYTGEYQIGNDIRTDRWDVALDAMIKVSEARYQQTGKKEANEVLKRGVTQSAEDVPTTT